MLSPFSLLLIALVLLVVFWRLHSWTKRRRARAGFGNGRVVDLDNTNMTAEIDGFLLSGRPDRLIKEGGMVIPEDLKSGTQVYPTHRIAMGLYFLLIEEIYGMRPTHGIIVLDGGKRSRVGNTPRLQAQVMALAMQEERQRRYPNQRFDDTPPNKHVAKCNGCGYRKNCKVRAY